VTLADRPGAPTSPAPRASPPANSPGVDGRRLEQEAFFHRHYPELAGWAAGLLRDRDAATDVASEAFVRLLPAWNRATDRRAFLYATAANLVRDRWRRESTRRRYLPFLQQQAADAAPEHDMTVRDLVDRLPERTKIPILLHYYADLTADDIAVQLGRPAGTVRRHLAEGRAALRTALESS
jgi:RNA polymerase sigma-70 factor (ECF subfamily)